jgi:hypothetical protein
MEWWSIMIIWGRARRGGQGRTSKAEGESANPQAKVRLQAKSVSSSSSPSTSTSASTQSEKHEETYAEIASHPASSSAPVVDHNPELDVAPSLVKARGQTQKGGAIELLTRVYEEKGLAGWYKGLGAQIVKAVLCQGTSSLSSFHLHLYSILYRIALLFVTT